MPTYAALLRGINVAGHKMMKMAAVKAVFEGLGCENVRTYLQSGNVVFDAAKTSEEALARKIERALGASALVLSAKKVAQTVAKNPFAKKKGVDATKLHVTFLFEAPAKAALAKLAAVNAGDDELLAAGELIYLHCPNGYGRSKLANNNIERILGVTATTRNWKTVNELDRLAGE